ncbi:hypothetical protein RJT34_17458 [Clitoria ternatea]|uniref:NAC domain-containing protein n=1 Tax=Clitoria ternatea TaxID=43366 RepID=A0AAN9JAA4_CLITE
MDIPLNNLPMGFRFQPSEEEIVDHFLKHKLLGNDSIVSDFIAEIDVCKFEPWDLPAFSKVKSNYHEWYFFSPVDLNPSTKMRKRKTNAGYWKSTGKDRNISVRGNENVIGTKKTLVFYKGRLKTNWVIGEYHATTFPQDKRCFVLCHLREKAEKNTERGTDTLVYDEGEPSSRIATNFENQVTVERVPDVSGSNHYEENTLSNVHPESIFRELPQAEEHDHLPSLQQPTIVTEQEQSTQSSTFPNAYFEKEAHNMQTSNETTKEEDNLDEEYIVRFLREILAGEDPLNGEETTPAAVNDSTCSPSLKKACYESSEIDAEPLSAQHGNILGSSSSVCNEHNISRQNPVVSMAKSSHDVVFAGSFPVSSGNEVNQEKKDSTSEDDSSEVDAFGDLTQITPLSIFLIERASPPLPFSPRSPSPSRRCKTIHHGLSINTLSVITDGSRGHREVWGQAVSPQEELDSSSEDELWEQDSSDDSTSIELDPWFIYRLIRRSPSPSPSCFRRSPSPPRRCHNEYHPRSCNFVSPSAAARKSLTKRNVLSRAVSSRKEVRKPICSNKDMESVAINKEQKIPQGASSRKKLEITCYLSLGFIGKGSFVHMETRLVQRSWYFFTRSCGWSYWHV